MLAGSVTAPRLIKAAPSSVDIEQRKLRSDAGVVDSFGHGVLAGSLAMALGQTPGTTRRNAAASGGK